MICKCPHCGDVITYSIEDKSLTCEGCGTTFSAGSVVNEDVWKQLETVECDLYKCSTCGAEITVNNVEAATFCGYCGQPTIVFNRVSSFAKPEKIIPFSVTKEEAEMKIRKYLKRSFFSWRKLRNFETERICGIYVPFWLYNLDYSSQQTLKGTEGNGKNSRTYYYFRECECKLSNLTIDASKELDNRSSQRLEPFDIHEAKDFDIAYLSGFYADRFDSSAKSEEFSAIYKAKELYDQEVIKTIPGRSVSIITDVPKYTINSVSYALLPVWFLSFLDENNNTYTIMVNGQTGKVVGALPFVKKLVYSLTFATGCILSLPCFMMLKDVLPSADSESTFRIIVLIIAIIVVLYRTGKKYWDKVRTSIYLTTAKDINKFAKERQEK